MISGIKTKDEEEALKIVEMKCTEDKVAALKKLRPDASDSMIRFIVASYGLNRYMTARFIAKQI
jgi:hypothetical protein